MYSRGRGRSSRLPRQQPIPQVPLKVSDDYFQEMLPKFQCPFTWHLKANNSQHSKSIFEKMKKKEFVNLNELESIFSFCSVYIVRAYEYTKMEGEEKLAITHALFSLREVEVLMPINDCEFNDAFTLIIQSMKLFLACLGKYYNDMNDVFKEVIKMKELDDKNKAAVLALRSIMYSYYGSDWWESSLSFIEDAIKLYPDFHLFLFLRGKFLMRLRHVQYPDSIPTVTELVSFKDARKAMPNVANYKAHLAQCYSDCARTYYFFLKEDGRKEPEVISKMNQMACDAFKECARAHPDRALILYRCARGILRLPYPFKDREYVFVLLKDALTLDPDDSFGLHTCALYYRGSNAKQYRYFLDLCVERLVFGAEMQLLQLDFTERRREIDVIERLNEMYEKYEDFYHRLGIICCKACYNFCISKKPVQAVMDMAEAVKFANNDITYATMLKHRSLFENYTIDLVGKISYFAKRHLKARITNEDRKVCENFLKLVRESRATTNTV